MQGTRFQSGWRSEIPAALIIMILAVAPLPFGSVSIVAICILLIVASVAVALFATGAEKLPAGGAVAAGALVVFAAYACTLYLQTISRDAADPLAHPIWREAGQILGQKLAATSSIAHEQPFYAVGLPLLSILMFLGGYFCGADDDHARRLLSATGWICGCYAVFAIMHFAVAPTMVLWQEKIAYLTSLTGPFTNRNAAGVYFGTGAVVWLVLAIQSITDGRSERENSRRSRRRRRRSLKSRLRLAILPISFFAACTIALLLSGSRAATACVLAGLCVIFSIALRQTLSDRNRRLLLILGGAIVIFVLYQVAGGSVGERLQSDGTEGGGRSLAYWAIVRMIEDFPALGTGLGTFQWSFTAYRTAQISAWGIWDKAHNIPLEIAAEGGLPLAIVVIAAWLVIMALLGWSIVRAARPLPLVIAAFSAALIALLHSLVDFSLQIPAYSVTIAALAGAATANVLKRSEVAPHR